MDEETAKCDCIVNGERCTNPVYAIYHHLHGVTFLCKMHFQVFLTPGPKIYTLT